MMKPSNIALLLATASLLACSSPETEKREPEIVRSSLARDTTPVLAPNDLATFADDQADFAVDLYHAVRKAPESAGQDVFLSPHSISTALAMTYAGARGETKAEMKKALHFGLEDNLLHRGFDYLDLALSSRGKNAEGKDGRPFRLSIANSVWGQKGFAFEAPFLDTLAVSYGTGLAVVDFQRDADDARLTINQWVEDKTESRIKDLLPSLESSTRLVLVNAVYFNAAWQTKFDDNGTSAKPFTKLDSSVTQVAMMHSQENRRFARGDGFEAVELAYDGGETSMLVIAPTKGSFATYEASLTGKGVLDLFAGLQPKQVKLDFPKAKLDATFDLSSSLSALGMKKAFADADFSGISGSAPLAISKVVHKTFLDIDEGGTEAAAATAVEITDTSAPLPLEPVTMIVDRPYIVAIVDRQTKTLIFLGRILEPKS